MIFDYSEADEIAESIGDYLIRDYRDAEFLANRFMRDQGSVMIANVAEAIWRRARRA